ncbi:MAG TPA: Crp/Fnr family transcriptional regulator [Puia sp.]|jgi:CRP-like cAMP-binding protein|nr:Crp/Fnr family transcriptional regulator [Puia sp.]
MEEIFEFLSLIYPLSPECLEYLRKVVRSRRLAKNEVVLRIGEVNSQLYFIKTGALHCYYFVNDKPVSDWFFWENETVVSIGSFYDQLPSEDCIVTMEETEVFFITKEQYDYACLTFLEFNFIARVLLEKYLKEFHGHARFLRKVKSKDRYQMVLQKYPEIVQRVPVGPLATWLGMEPETLSRKRGKRD